MASDDIKAIPRNLEEGWHFRPNWRSIVVDTYLACTEPGADPLDVLRGEGDSYVRQGYLFRRTGRCVNAAAFQYAHGCVSNPASGAATTIKALAMVKTPIQEIAAILRTAPKNIAVFLRLHWDIARYQDERAWLASIIFSPGAQGNEDLTGCRDQHWLGTAFLYGRRGLDHLLSRNVTLTEGERAEMTDQIRIRLTARAHEFLRSLQNGTVPATQEDFRRFVQMLDVSSRQPPVKEEPKLMLAFIRGIHGAMKEKANSLEFRDDPALEIFRNRNVPEAVFSDS